MKKEDFVNFIKKTLKAVENDDSAEGSIRYEWGKERDLYNVNAFVRVGNSMGQGGCVLVNEKLRDDPPQGPEEIEESSDAVTECGDK